MEDKNKPKQSDIAGRTYDVSDYGKDDELSKGLATTHEQVSDAYMEGEIRAVIDDLAGEDVEIRHEGLEEESK